MSDFAPAPQEPASPLGGFVGALLSGGELHLNPPDGTTPVVDPAVEEKLREAHLLAGEELAGDAPEYDAAAAGWAAGQFYQACQFMIGRDTPAEKVLEAMRRPCPSTRGPASDFSADLVFRFLPELHERARRLAPGDPLVTALERWAREWPLSSPGVTLAAPPALDTFAGCPPLWRLYVDRVTARQAADRWRDPRVAGQLRADLGALPGLAPALADALRRAEAAETAVNPREPLSA